MRIRRLLSAVSSVIVLSFVASVPASEAAEAYTFVITGPGMRHPVTLSWAQMSEALDKDVARHGGDPLHGFHPFFHSLRAPKGTLGPAYALKVFRFIPSTPPRPLDIEHWTYYPQRDAIHTDDARNPWLQPVPSLRSELDHAIASGKGKNLVLVVVGAMSILLAMLGLLVAFKRRSLQARRPTLGSAP